MASRAAGERLAAAQPQLSIQLVGGPTAILEYGGLLWLTDPTLSPPGEYGGLTKLTGPVLDMAQQEPIDVVLLSHHHHTDNLDPAGRAFLASANRVLSTTKAADELGGNVVGMESWTQPSVSWLPVRERPQGVVSGYRGSGGGTSGLPDKEPRLCQVPGRH